MPMHPFRRLGGFAAASLLAVATFAGAQSTGGPSSEETKPPGADKAPAKEAIDACAGKTEGDRVVFMDAKHKRRKWTCVMVDGNLAARSGIATPAIKPKS